MATTVGEITGELILRVHSEEVSLGLISIPVQARTSDSGDLTLTARTREIRDMVQEISTASERISDGDTVGSES